MRSMRTYPESNALYDWQIILDDFYPRQNAPSFSAASPNLRTNFQSVHPGVARTHAFTPQALWNRHAQHADPATTPRPPAKQIKSGRIR